MSVFFKSFVCNILIYKIKQVLFKKKKVREKYLQACLNAKEESFSIDDFDDDRLRAIKTVIDTMPQKTKYVLDQCYMEEKKYMEVADDLGITRDGVRKHIVKALKILRDALLKDK